MPLRRWTRALLEPWSLEEDPQFIALFKTDQKDVRKTLSEKHNKSLYRYDARALADREYINALRGNFIPIGGKGDTTQCQERDRSARQTGPPLSIPQTPEAFSLKLPQPEKTAGVSRSRRHL